MTDIFHQAISLEIDISINNIISLQFRKTLFYYNMSTMTF